MPNHTVSKVYRATTAYMVLKPRDADIVFDYVSRKAKSGDEGSEALLVALLVQHCPLPDGNVAFVTKQLERLRFTRKKQVRSGSSDPGLEEAVASIDNAIRIANGIEVRAAVEAQLKSHLSRFTEQAHVLTEDKASHA